jgi:hypothetical protein
MNMKREEILKRLKIIASMETGQAYNALIDLIIDIEG